LNDAGIDLTADFEQIRAAKQSGERILSSSASAESTDEPDFRSVRPPQTQPSRVTSLRWDAANWELNEKLRHVERVTTVSRRRYDSAPPTALTPPHVATFPAQPPPAVSPYASVPQAAAFPSPTWPTAYAAPPHPTNPYSPPPYEPIEPPAPPPQYYESNVVIGGVARLIASLVSWLFLGGAITAFSCGGFLAAWGGLNDRPAVQQLGMPVVLLGLISRVIGLLPQIFLRRLEEHEGREVAELAAVRLPGRARPHQMSRAPAAKGSFAGR
jgi:hypothetical protein